MTQGRFGFLIASCSDCGKFAAPVGLSAFGDWWAWGFWEAAGGPRGPEVGRDLDEARGIEDASLPTRFRRT